MAKIALLQFESQFLGFSSVACEISRHFLRKSNFIFAAAWISEKSYGNFGIRLDFRTFEEASAWISGIFVEILVIQRLAWVL